MTFLKDVTSIINNSPELEQIDSHNRNSQIIPNFFSSKEAQFAEELKLSFNWSTTEKNDALVQTTKKPGRGRPPKKANINFFRARDFKNQS